MVYAHRMLTGIAIFVGVVVLVVQWIEHDRRTSLQRKFDQQQVSMLVIAHTIKAQKNLNDELSSAVISLLKDRAAQLHQQGLLQRRGLAATGG